MKWSETSDTYRLKGWLRHGSVQKDEVYRSIVTYHPMWYWWSGVDRNFILVLALNLMFELIKAHFSPLYQTLLLSSLSFSLSSHSACLISLIDDEWKSTSWFRKKRDLTSKYIVSNWKYLASFYVIVYHFTKLA